MASIFRRKDGNYYLNERVNGKVVKTYLGIKPPLSKGMPTTNLTLDLIERLKQRAKQVKRKPKPNPELPDGQFSVIYAYPPWRYDFVQVTNWGG